MNILQINASARREGAHSTRLADPVVRQLQARYRNATLTRRDLAVTGGLLMLVAHGAGRWSLDARR